MNEGLADVYSTLKPMGKKAMIGDLIPGDVQVLQNQKWMTFDALTQVDHQSQAYNEKNRAGTFYAESWALVHMLFLSPEYAPKFPAFLVAISSGKSAAEACQAAYSRSSAQVFKDLQMYFHRNRLFGATFNVSLSKSEEEAEASPIDTLGSEIVLADILAASADEIRLMRLTANWLPRGRMIRIFPAQWDTWRCRGMIAKDFGGF